jgi:hypothetical protein
VLTSLQAFFVKICLTPAVKDLRTAKTVLFIDADDTLWHDSKHFRKLEVVFADCALEMGCSRAKARDVLGPIDIQDCTKMRNMVSGRDGQTI